MENEVKQVAHENMTKGAGLKAKRFAYCPQHCFPKNSRKSSPQSRRSVGAGQSPLLVPTKKP